jgi:hypothetical protein
MKRTLSALKPQTGVPRMPEVLLNLPGRVRVNPGPLARPRRTPMHAP